MDVWNSRYKILDKYIDLPHRNIGESVLIDHIPDTAKLTLDLGTGDGSLLRLNKTCRYYNKIEEAIAIDMSPNMLKRVKENFAGDNKVKIIEYDLQNLYRN